MISKDGYAPQDDIADKRKRSAILRNLQMLDLIPQYPSRITVTQLHRQLTQEYGYQISKRSVQRDLEALSEWAGIDYENYDSGRTWFRDLNQRKHTSMNPVDAFMLLTTHEHDGNLFPLQFHAHYASRLAEAKAMFARGQRLAHWRAKISVIRGGYPVTTHTHDETTALRHTLYDATLNEQQLDIAYQASGHNTSARLIVNPLAIIIRDHSHYLVATKAHSPETPQLFLFHRISAAVVTYLPITPPTRFDVHEYLATNPSGWLLKEVSEEICLSLRNFALDNIQRHPLGENQRLTPARDGWTSAHFCVALTYDLIAWILKFGADVKVESPAYLQDKVIKILKESLDHYAN